MNALVFLYKKVLNLPLDDEINAVRAHKKVNVPVVMAREESLGYFQSALTGADKTKNLI